MICKNRRCNRTLTKEEEHYGKCLTHIVLGYKFAMSKLHEELEAEQVKSQNLEKELSKFLNQKDRPRAQ